MFTKGSLTNEERLRSDDEVAAVFSHTQLFGELMQLYITHEQPHSCPTCFAPLWVGS